MPDLLIRDLSVDLKNDIARSAKKSGKSLSDEAKRLLAKAMINKSGKLPMGQAIRETFAQAGFVELELPPRTDTPRDPFEQ